MMARPRIQRITRVIENKINQLSDVASVFALACTDPWHEVCNNVCLPVKSQGSSYKTRVVKRIMMTAGDKGFGFVAFSPCLANDYPTIAYSSSATLFVTSAVSTSSATAGVTVAALDKLPYASGNLTGTLSAANSVAGRIVSYGIKVNYIGTELNKGGVYYRYVSLDREPVNGATADILGAFNTCTIRPVDRQEMVAVVNPLNDHEIAYSNEDQNDNDYVLYPYANSETGTATTVPAIGCIVVAGTTAGNTFEVQVIEHVEYIGKAAQPFLSETRTDVVGFEEVTSALGRMASGQPNADPRIKPAQALAAILRQRGHSLSPRTFQRVRGAAYGMRMAGGIAASTMGGLRSFLR